MVFEGQSFLINVSVGTNYDSKKGLVWDLADKHRDKSLLFEAIWRHPSYKTNFSPQISKAKYFEHLLRFLHQNKQATYSSFEPELPVTRCCVQVMVPDGETVPDGMETGQLSEKGILVIFVFGAKAPSGPGPPHSKSHQRHTAVGRTVLDE